VARVPTKTRKRPAPADRPLRNHSNRTKSNGYEAPGALDSQQVSWWSVHEFVSAVLNQVNDWPMLGTPAWCCLAHDDPRKWSALLDGAQHWALRLETCQEARAEASRAVSGAVDWPNVSREMLQLSSFRNARRGRAI
jgi:hypothetical protein